MSEQIKCKKHYNAIPLNECPMCLITQRDDLLATCEGALEAMDKPAVQCEGDWQTGMFCGLEDKNITDRYEACLYGYERALEKVREWVLCDFEAAIAAAQPSSTSVAPTKSGKSIREN